MAGLGALGVWPALPVRAAPAQAQAGTSAHDRDWAWLTGNWDVRHQRLRERLVGSTDWETFGGRSAVWPTLGGLGNLDDNLVDLPAGAYGGVSLRAYDAASDTWAIWWLDGRNPTRIDPPVHGRFDGDTGVFIGHDTLRDKPIVMRFTWRAIHGPEPWWEQAFSPDDGKQWEVNWRNWFTRTATAPSPLPTLPDAPHDWDFLRGKWRVQHRRLRDPFGNGSDWETFDGELKGWPVLGGHGHVADIALHPAGGNEHALRMYTYDPKTRQWLAWRLDLRDPTRIGAPDRGSTSSGAITFLGEDRIGTQSVQTRSIWSPQGPNAARHEQAVSADGDKRWTTWWTSDLKRAT